MTATVIRLPSSRANETALDAATEWILSELDGAASIAAMREVALREITRPRDVIHLRWAQTFLEETKGYL